MPIGSYHKQYPVEKCMLDYVPLRNTAYLAFHLALMKAVNGYANQLVKNNVQG